MKTNILPPIENHRDLDHGYSCVVAVFRDEETILKEWCFHNLNQGFDHMYLYDNGSTDNSLELLQPFVERGYATVIPWGGNRSPNWLIDAYYHAILNFRMKWRWMAFIDTDEFLFCRHNNIAAALRDIKTCSVCVPWTMFGSGGHKTPPESVIKGFTQRVKYPLPDDVYHRVRNWKSIVDPMAVESVHNPHFCKMRDLDRIGSYTEHGDVIDMTNNHDKYPYCDNFRLNHYYTRSLQDFEDKLDRYPVPRSHPYLQTRIKIMEELERLPQVEDLSLVNKYK